MIIYLYMYGRFIETFHISYSDGTSIGNEVTHAGVVHTETLRVTWMSLSCYGSAAPPAY